MKNEFGTIFVSDIYFEVAYEAISECFGEKAAVAAALEAEPEQYHSMLEERYL